MYETGLYQRSWKLLQFQPGFQRPVSLYLGVTVVPSPPPAVGGTLVSVLSEGGPGRVSRGLLL